MSITIKPKYTRYVLSIAFANYKKAKSGMPKVVLAHEQLFNKNGISYIYLFAVKKVFRDDNSFVFFRFGVIVDGFFCGILNTNEIVKLLKRLNISGIECVGIHIHHLLYMKLPDTFTIIDSIQDAPIYVFLHDYYLCCTNYTLLRDGISFCGGGGLNERHCENCKFYTFSCQIQRKIHKYLNERRDRIVYVSPSNITRDIYLSFHPEWENTIIVVPHQIPYGHNTDNTKVIEKDERVTLGFLGFPAKHKGWESFCQLHDLYEDTYRYVVFNSLDQKIDGMKHVHVAVSSKNPTAMIDALKKECVAISFLWAQTPETYSYTCMEAYAANTFVVTCKGSGNIEDYIEAENIGIVLKDDRELIEFFSNEDIVKRVVNTYRKNSLGGPEKWIDNEEVCKLITENNRFTNTGNVLNSHIEYSRQDLLSKMAGWLYRAIVK